MAFERNLDRRPKKAREIKGGKMRKRKIWN